MVKLSSGESQISLNFNLDTTLFRIFFFFLRGHFQCFSCFMKSFMCLLAFVWRRCYQSCDGTLIWSLTLVCNLCSLHYRSVCCFVFFPVKENIIRVISPSKGAISLFWVKNSMNLKTKRKKEKRSVSLSWCLARGWYLN